MEPRVSLTESLAHTSKICSCILRVPRKEKVNLTEGLNRGINRIVEKESFGGSPGKRHSVLGSPVVFTQSDPQCDG